MPRRNFWCRRLVGFAFSPRHWRVRWTSGEWLGEEILWLGPVGLVVRWGR